MTLLVKVVNSLPPKSRATARKLFSRKTNNSKKNATTNHYLNEILKVENITLPEEIDAIFNTCKEKPREFWKFLGLRLDIKWRPWEASQSLGGFNLVDAASQAYLGLQGFSKHRAWDTVVWRFFTLFFYELALLIGNGATLLTSKLCDRLLHIITASSKIKDDPHSIRRNLGRWTAVGSRYHKLCASLSPGALFLLPQLPDITFVSLPCDPRIC